MTRRRRHAIIVIDRPEGWQPAGPEELPPAPTLFAEGYALGEAAEVARKLNAEELAAPTGRWFLPVKTMQPSRKAKGRKRD